MRDTKWLGNQLTTLRKAKSPRSDGKDRGILLLISSFGKTSAYHGTRY